MSTQSGSERRTPTPNARAHFHLLAQTADITNARVPRPATPNHRDVWVGRTQETSGFNRYPSVVFTGGAGLRTHSRRCETGDETPMSWAAMNLRGVSVRAALGDIHARATAGSSGLSKSSRTDSAVTRVYPKCVFAFDR